MLTLSLKHTNKDMLVARWNKVLMNCCGVNSTLNEFHSERDSGKSQKLCAIHSDCVKFSVLYPYVQGVQAKFGIIITLKLRQIVGQGKFEQFVKHSLMS